MENNIDFFRGRYYFLSNFYDAPTAYEGVIYPTSEHAYQAAKTFDLEARKLFLNGISAGQAKKLGRNIPMRPDWNTVRVNIMFYIVLDKFIRNKDLRQELIETGDALLIEGNTWGDVFWGRVNGQGENHLGRILMAVRALFRGTPQKPEMPALDLFCE